jgi:hypothetical protein
VGLDYRVLLGLLILTVGSLRTRKGWERGRAVDFCGEEENGLQELIRSEYSTIKLIHPVNIVDQDHRSNETITANQANDFQKARCHQRCASGWVHCFETLRQ